MTKLFVTLAYTVDTGRWEITSTNMTTAGYITLIENYLRDITGAGTDESVANWELETYEITLAIDLSHDDITVKSDCGNLGLVAGILMTILKELGDAE